MLYCSEDYKGEAWKWIIVFPLRAASVISLIYLQYHFTCNCSICNFFYLFIMDFFLDLFDKIFLDKIKEYSWKRMGRANLHADRCCIYPPVFSGKSDRIFCKSASFLQRKSCCNATVFPSYVGAPAVFLSSVSFYSEIFRRLEFSTLWVTLKSCLEWRSENRRILILLQKNK